MESIDALAASLQPLPLEALGSPAWLRQHEIITKLSIQAHVDASSSAEDDSVKAALIRHNKLNTIIYALIDVEVWRLHVKPHLERLGYADESTMAPYMVQYHEVTVLTLLETVFYHRDACEAAADCLLDLIDYCHRAMQHLISRTPEDVAATQRLASLSAAEIARLSSAEQLAQQTCELPLQLASKAVTIVRYITDHINHLPLSCMTRMLNTFDFPVALVQLLVNSPWVRQFAGQLQKYTENQQWETITASERHRLSKMEGQVWLALYNLLMEPECRRKYEIRPQNRAELLKIRTYLSDAIVEQIPVLGELRRAMEELALIDPPPPQRSLIIEQVPEIYDQLIRAHRNKFEDIAKTQLAEVFKPNEETRRAQAMALAEMYNFDALEAMIPEAPVCATCGAPATNRCSRCQTEWYCRRQCQVEHWPKHKAACSVMAQKKDSATIKPQE